jgi:hypothetical protein
MDYSCHGGPVGFQLCIYSLPRRTAGMSDTEVPVENKEFIARKLNQRGPLMLPSVDQPDHPDLST